jgi:threonine/homoserine/homoserine lactone efflux protein
MDLLKIFLWGMIVSFLGTLPPGTLNVAAMQISVQENILNAINFSTGTIVTEMIFARMSLVGINWLRKQKALFRWLEWITFAIVVALAIGSFHAANNPAHQAKNFMLVNDVNRFLLGMFLSAISPMHIPFWFGWSTILFTKKILKANNSSYNIFVLGIGIGSFFGCCVFIFGGKYIVEKLDANVHILNWVIGGVFALTAVIQLLRILLHKDAAEKLDKLEDIVMHE